MKLDPYIGDVIVEVAFSTVPDDPAPVYVDVTDYVAAGTGITITRGRQDEYGTCNPATCTLTLDNTNGYFTAGYAGSPWFPNVKIRKKLRVSTIVGGTTYRRFTGYVEEWPTEWPGGGDYSIVQVTAVDRFKRLGAIAKFRSIIEQEYQLDSPFAHYTMGDAAGSTQAGDVSTGGRPPLAIAQLGTGGTLVFGTATGPGTDGLTALTLTPTNSTNGKYLKTTLTNDVAKTDASIECFFNTSTAAEQCILELLTTDGHSFFALVEIDATGKLKAYGGTPIVSAGSVADGLTHHCAVTVSYNAGTFNLTTSLYLDGALVGTDINNLGAGSHPAWGTNVFSVGGVDVINTGNGGVFNGVIAHAGVYDTALSAARVSAHSTSGLTGFSGERSDQRIARYASYCGIPTAEQNLETGLSTSIAAVDITGQAPLQAMQDVTDTESGVLFMDGQGRLAFQSRNHRYVATSALTLAGEDVSPATKYISNDALIVNDVTASRAGGITVRVVNKQSITDNGTIAITPTLLTTSDNEVVDAANWKANQTAVVVPRLPNVTVDILTNPNIAASMLALDIGSRFTLGTLPQYAPAPSADWFIEGLTETITETGYVFGLNTSPASQSGVWILDSATYSQLDVSTRLAY